MIRFYAREHWLADAVVLLCGYEIIAITSRRVPTLTAIQRKYRVLGPALILGLAVHFYLEDLRLLRRFRVIDLEAIDNG